MFVYRSVCAIVRVYGPEGQPIQAGRGRLPPSSESWQAAWLWPHLHSAATREEAAAQRTRDRKEGSAALAGRGGFLIMGGSVRGGLLMTRIVIIFNVKYII